MGAAWRSSSWCKKQFQQNLKSRILNESQAKALIDVGLTAYNQNLDTSREYYPKTITTRTYYERLETISNVREAGISVCSGGIIRLGETPEDRLQAPLKKQEPVTIWEMVRMISTTRIVMPKSMVKLSAGRVQFSQSEQALCFFAGENSIFTGDKLLATNNNDFNSDQEMFKTLGLFPKPPNFDRGTSPSNKINEVQEKQTQNILYLNKYCIVYYQLS
ncbi:radical SAM enzyme [Rhizophagus irregularis]|uniref:Radical SAM enzyme n=1 Tax=Rhizophagus irregularis TaxID=588596 RepID=A0A2N0Q0I4_9GLOM|nr:radical SAM enzyme [Rhizophagus irregularis]